MPPGENVHVGVAAVVVRDASLLMVKRGGVDSSHGQGTWSAPGGWVDDGENPTDAVAREVMEETGLAVVSAPQPFYVTTAFFDDLTSVCLWYHASAGAAELPRPVNREKTKHEAVCWLPKAFLELGEIPLFDHLCVLVDKRNGWGWVSDSR